MMTRRYLALTPLLVLAGACQPDATDTQSRETPAPEESGAMDGMREDGMREATPRARPNPAPQRVAEAKIAATEGNDAAGTVRFVPAGEGVRVEGTITGLKPGAHGLHIHARGDCSAPDASSAGGHFSPDDNPHGSPEDLPDQHHAGDLGNVVAGEDGSAKISAEDPEIRLSGPESIVGKAVIVHAGRDDFETQPSGDSGARVGCGVIRETTRAAGVRDAGTDRTDDAATTRGG